MWCCVACIGNVGNKNINYDNSIHFHENNFKERLDRLSKYKTFYQKDTYGDWIRCILFLFQNYRVSALKLDNLTSIYTSNSLGERGTFIWRRKSGRVTDKILTIYIQWTPSISNFSLSPTIFSVPFHWFQSNFLSLYRINSLVPCKFEIESQSTVHKVSSYRGFLITWTVSENICTIEVTGKAVNLGDGEGMQVSCILKFELTRNCIEIFKMNLQNL